MAQAGRIYAHSKPGSVEKDWELLYGPGGHAERTRQVIETFASFFPPETWSLTEVEQCMRIMALAHDMGKADPQWQQYFRNSATGRRADPVDHKHAAAAWALHHVKPEPLGIMMAYAFAGHHSGLPSGVDLIRKIRRMSLSREVQESLPDELRGSVEFQLPVLGYGIVGKDDKYMLRELAVVLSMVVRMLHSALIDADWTATALYMDGISEVKKRASLSELSVKLEAYIAQKEQGKLDRINALRQEIHNACYTAAAQEPGMFRLNVPTGGGKTLSSLSFALRHALLHGKQRVIYVIPFTSIIEQTAEQFREALGADNVVEHHSNVSEENDNEENQRAVENWDAPIIVTTGVQFFESLFSAKNSRCRKVHNIAQSVIIFDEAQTLPTHLLAPCIAAMKALQHEFGCTLVLCTATQPAFIYDPEKFPIGWVAEESRSLIGKDLEERLHSEMKRVEVEYIGRNNKEELVEHFLASGAQSALFIVNLTRQAQDLFTTLQERGVENVYHLSARMCPAHRSKVLAEIHDRLEEEKPTVLVATRVVEAGVDISFPVVYRDKCGLDSLAQSAGRCNRNGELAMGRVFYFDDPEYQLSPSMADLREGAYIMSDFLDEMGSDMTGIFTQESVERYFQKFFMHMRTLKDMSDWDRQGVMPLLGMGGEKLEAWSFSEIAEKFRMIPGEQKGLIIPYGEEGERLRTRLLELDKLKLMPTREDYRKIQQFSVAVYDQEWNNIPKEPIHHAAGLFMLTDSAFYDQESMGLLREPKDGNYVF